MAKYDTYKRLKLKASNGETSDDPIILIVIETKHNPLNYIKSLIMKYRHACTDLQEQRTLISA